MVIIDALGCAGCDPETHVQMLLLEIGSTVLHLLTLFSLQARKDGYQSGLLRTCVTCNRVRVAHYEKELHALATK